MKDKKIEFTENLMFELRKEIIENQNAYNKILEFKFAIITLTVGLLVPYINIKSLNFFSSGSVTSSLPIFGDNSSLIFNILYVYLIPPFVALCFDFVINNYRKATQRIGDYNRECLEPYLKKNGNFPKDLEFYEEYVSKRRFGISLFGTFGLTLVASIPTFYYLLLFIFQSQISYLQVISIIFFIVLAVMIYFDFCLFMYTHKDSCFPIFNKIIKRNLRKQQEKRDNR